MKRKLLNYLISPVEKERFRIKIFKSQKIRYSDGKTGQEIIDGVLYTKNEWYPIIGGVPRILWGQLKNAVLTYYPDYIKRYKKQLKKFLENDDSVGDIYSDINKKTMSKFGFQWNYFDDMDSGLNYEDWMSNAVDHKIFFKGKLALEVGAGAGGHTLKTLKYGAEVIATDLSHAIDVTYKKTKRHPKSHCIQADLYKMPFKHYSFDIVYCLGVLQHLPEPRHGFNELSLYVKKNGSLFTNLYSNTRKFQLFVEDIIRFFIKPLPNNAILLFSHIFNILDHLVFIWPYKIFKKVGFSFICRIFPSRTDIYSKLGFRKSLDDWFDRLSAPIIIRYAKKDLESWYRKKKFNNIKVYDFNNTNWVGYGKKS